MPKGNMRCDGKIKPDKRCFLLLNGLKWDFTELDVRWYIIEKGEQNTNKKNFTTFLRKFLQ